MLQCGISRKQEHVGRHLGVVIVDFNFNRTCLDIHRIWLNLPRYLEGSQFWTAFWIFINIIPDLFKNNWIKNRIDLSYMDLKYRRTSLESELDSSSTRFCLVISFNVEDSGSADAPRSAVLTLAWGHMSITKTRLEVEDHSNGIYSLSYLVGWVLAYWLAIWNVRVDFPTPPCRLKRRNKW